MNRQISLIIPTLNRSEHVIRMLEYLRDVNFDGCVMIGDSSGPTHLEPTKNFIKTLSAPFEIIYREYPGERVFCVIKNMIPIVETPYIMWIPDDDLPVPGTLQECAEFLNDNPEYNVAGGMGIVLYQDSNNGRTAIATQKYAVREITNNTANERLSNLLNNYTVTAYSLNRLERFRERYLLSGDVNFADERFGNELFNCCMLVVQGKVKMLDRLFVVRQIHNQRYLLPSIFDWMTSEGWLSSYQTFRDCIAKEIVKIDGIDKTYAEDILKNAFYSYLYKSLCRKDQIRRKKKKCPSIFTHIKKRMKNMRGVDKYLLPVWRFIRYDLFNRDRFSLKALLSFSSPYHKDFMPVYRAITGDHKRK